MPGFRKLFKKNAADKKGIVMKPKYGTVFFAGLLFASTLILGTGSGYAELVSYWSFNEDSETTAHDSAASNDGTVYDGANPGATWMPGKIGGSLAFDGANDYVNTGDSNDWKFGTGDFSVSFWMKADTWTHGSGEPTEYMTLMGNGNYGYNWDGFHFGRVGAWWSNVGLGPEGSVMMFLGNGIQNSGVSSKQALSAGIWYHVVGTRESGTANFYLDGVLTQSAGLGLDITVNRALTIGKQNDPNYPRYFDGAMDDVAFWDEALTVDDIKQVINFSAGVYDFLKTDPHFPGYSTADIDTLYEFYQDAKTSGPQTTTISDKNWQYFPDTDPAWVLAINSNLQPGEYVTDGDNYYIKLGSGIGSPLSGSVPEPASVSGMLIGFLALCLRRLRGTIREVTTTAYRPTSRPPSPECYPKI